MWLSLFIDIGKILCWLIFQRYNFLIENSIFHFKGNIFSVLNASNIKIHEENECPQFSLILLLPYVIFTWLALLMMECVPYQQAFCVYLNSRLGVAESHCKFFFTF
jgi:hypothetical protein